MHRQSQEQSTGMITMNMALLVVSQHIYTWTPVPALLTRGRVGAVLGGRRGGSLCSCAKSSKTRLFKKEKKKERQASPHPNDPTCKASDSSHPASRQRFTEALGRTPTFSSLKSSSTLQSLATQAWRPRRDGLALCVFERERCTPMRGRVRLGALRKYRRTHGRGHPGGEGVTGVRRGRFLLIFYSTAWIFLSEVWYISPHFQNIIRRAKFGERWV